MKLKDIQAKYKIGLRHNPDHFYPNTFEIETEGRRLILVAVAKKHIQKRLRIVGILKPR